METRENYDALFQEAPQAVVPAQDEPRAPMDKEAWAAKQKEQREALYERADKTPFWTTPPLCNGIWRHRRV